MLSKEEIEKAKERIQNSLNDICFATLYSQEENNEDEQILLQYIDQLEQENNKQNKMIDEMSCMIYDYANLGSLGICDCELEDGRIDLNLCNQTLTDRNCKQCIKQYFEKKVEEKINERKEKGKKTE